MSSRYAVNYQLRQHKRDQLIEFIKTLLLTPFVLTVQQQPYHSSSAPNLAQLPEPTTAAEPFTEISVEKNEARYADIMLRIEQLIDDHRAHDERGTACHSRLYALCPAVGKFFTRLPLHAAFLHQNHRDRLSHRRHVPPSFNDIRRVLNQAQIMESAKGLKLMTFDGDVTLYEDGEDLKPTSPLVSMLIGLLKQGLYVAIVTAAGYTQAERYEDRLHGLLVGMKESQLSQEMASRLYVVGGECNYLLQCTYPDFRLSHQTLTPPFFQDYPPAAIQEFLNVAESSLQRCIDDLHLPATVLRKERAVGLLARQTSIPLLNPYSGGQPRSYRMRREQLDECVLATQRRLQLHYAQQSTGNGRTAPGTITCSPSTPPPHCVFNGGRDVWVDVGNKLIGVQMLQRLLNSRPEETIHVGDQFLSTGNDIATRTACCTIWIVSPEETEQILDDLLVYLSQE